MSLLWHGFFWTAALWSGVSPLDRLTWLLEVPPAFAIYASLLVFRRYAPLSGLAVWLALCLCVIIFIGGHFGFAAVPGFEGLRELPGGAGSRNEFDKLAHFLQGFVPAVLFREALIRFRVIRHPHLIAPLTVAVTLALSAVYELCEWASYLWLGARATDFIGSQGDVWDAQSDMALALFGALIVVYPLSGLHDAALKRDSHRDVRANSVS